VKIKKQIIVLPAFALILTACGISSSPTQVGATTMEAYITTQRKISKRECLKTTQQYAKARRRQGFFGKARKAKGKSASQSRFAVLLSKS
jgi:hypothetical protein